MNLAIETKIDWLSFSYFPNRENPHADTAVKMSIVDQIKADFGLNFDYQTANLYRDSLKGIAVKVTKKFVGVELEGCFFKRDSKNLRRAQAVYAVLNSNRYVTEKWSVSRIDIAKTIKGITIEELVPDREKYEYSFDCKEIITRGKKKTGLKIETLQMNHGKTSIVFYRKDIQLSSLDQRLLDKKNEDWDYMSQPTTRAEVRFKSGCETLKLAALSLDSSVGNEEEFCNRLLNEGLYKKRVRIRNLSDSNKARWKIESRWASLFFNGSKKLAIKKIVNFLMSRPKKEITKPSITKEILKFVKSSSKMGLGEEARSLALEWRTLLKSSRRYNDSISPPIFQNFDLNLVTL